VYFVATTVQTDEGRPLRDEPDVDADRATTRAGQVRPDYNDHYDVRLRGHRDKGVTLTLCWQLMMPMNCGFVASDLLLL